MSEGGLDSGGRWHGAKPDFFLPARAVMAMFRGKMLDLMRRGLIENRLRLPGGGKTVGCTGLSLGMLRTTGFMPCGFQSLDIRLRDERLCRNPGASCRGPWSRMSRG